MQPKRWIITAGVLSLAACLLVAATNFLIDPWGLNEVLAVEGFNANKPNPLSTARLHKAYGALRFRPTAIVAGTSTAEHGISLQHPAWQKYESSYNLSFPGASIGEIKAIIQQAHRVSPLKHATIGLDLFSFNANYAANAQTDEAVEAMRSIAARVKPYFTRNMLRASVKTVWYQDTLGPYYLSNGQSSREALLQWRTKSRGIFNLFAFSTRQTVRGLLPQPAYRFEFQRGPENSTLDQFRELVEFAQHEGIELQFFFSPYHAWQYETMRAIGVWPFFELLKQQITHIVAPYAQAAPGRPRVTLWDFADYSAATTETVPPPTDADSLLRWTWDGQHYTTELGNLMQDRMAGIHSATSPLSGDFGIMLDEQNVDAHLLALRERQKKYRESHAEAVAIVEGIAARTLASLRSK